MNVETCEGCIHCTFVKQDKDGDTALCTLNPPIVNDRYLSDYPLVRIKHGRISHYTADKDWWQIRCYQYKGVK